MGGGPLVQAVFWHQVRAYGRSPIRHCTPCCPLLRLRHRCRDNIALLTRTYALVGCRPGSTSAWAARPALAAGVVRCDSHARRNASASPVVRMWLGGMARTAATSRPMLSTATTAAQNLAAPGVLASIREASTYHVSSSSRSRGSRCLCQVMVSCTRLGVVWTLVAPNPLVMHKCRCSSLQ